MIDGLTLTFSGHELRGLLDRRIAWHRERAARWTTASQRMSEDATDAEILLPTHMCEHEAEEHAWRADVLTFIRDHVDAAETYRLREQDLEFGELLPEQPSSSAQSDYDDRTRVGFNLERLVKSVDGLAGLTYALMSRRLGPDEPEPGTDSGPADDEFARHEST